MKKSELVNFVNIVEGLPMVLCAFLAREEDGHRSEGRGITTNNCFSHTPRTMFTTYTSSLDGEYSQARPENRPIITQKLIKKSELVNLYEHRGAPSLFFKKLARKREFSGRTGCGLLWLFFTFFDNLLHVFWGYVHKFTNFMRGGLMNKKILEMVERWREDMEKIGIIRTADLVEEVRLVNELMTSQQDFAEELGIDEAELSNVLAGRKLPGPAIRKFLGVEKVVVYRFVAQEKGKGEI
jgi:hypothetical protein